MIASFANNFIFVKNRKVGGTSVEIVLSSWCSGRDIVTLIPPRDELIRFQHGGRPMNFCGPDGELAFYNHMPAADIRAALPALWRSAFTFAIDRHPYEKVVSRAWWNIARKGLPETELEPEIDKAIETQSYLNYPLYCVDGKVIVDELWRFDEMWDRLAVLAKRLGKTVPAEPPRAKSGFRKDRRPARTVLSDAQKSRIYRDAEIEFALLGYQP